MSVLALFLDVISVEKLHSWLILDDDQHNNWVKSVTLVLMQAHFPVISDDDLVHVHSCSA